MDIFRNYKDEECILTDEQKEHILARHPDADLQLISNCLKDPIEVRKSNSNNISQLYYMTKTESRLFCVVVKICDDGNFISTAYTTSRMKSGETVYKKVI